MAAFLVVEKAMSYRMAAKAGGFDAIGVIVQHPNITEKIGKIISYHTYFQGTTILFANGRGQVQAHILITGERGNLPAYVTVEKNGKAWHPTSVTFKWREQWLGLDDAEGWLTKVHENTVTIDRPSRTFSLAILSSFVIWGVGISLTLAISFVVWRFAIRRNLLCSRQP